MPPALFNRIFADSDDRCRVLDWKPETLTEDAPETWRKTFFDGPKPWEEEVDWRADHHLKRVYEAQRNGPPPRQILPTKTLEERLACHKSKQLKGMARLRRRLQTQDAEAEQSSQSSTGSSSTSSESDGSVSE